MTRSSRGPGQTETGSYPSHVDDARLGLVPEVSRVTEAVQGLEQLETLLQLSLKLRDGLGDKELSIQRFGGLEVCLANIRRPHAEAVNRSEGEQEANGLRLQFGYTVNHESFHAIVMSAYYVPRLELDLTVFYGLDGKHEAIWYDVTAGRNFFSQDDVQFPTV